MPEVVNDLFVLLGIVIRFLIVLYISCLFKLVSMDYIRSSRGFDPEYHMALGKWSWDSGSGWIVTELYRPGDYDWKSVTDLKSTSPLSD